MEVPTDTYEKLGTFYLGKEYDLAEKALSEDLLLYDSKDLVTHGVVLGMTGSGKTGLCISLLEEAAMDRIPAIVIDPKGDIANLLLTFPDLAPEDFRPWINEDDAAKRGKTADEFAADQAALWREGLADWGQSPERIAAFRENVDMAVYTPGSSAGLPVSILSSLDVPGFEVLDDAELLSERIESTVSSLLSLIGIDADPIQDAEHILLSNIFAALWGAGRGITLESLIQSIQVPPFDKIGVMDLETVCPEKDRRELAMRFNNLLASPGFATWLKGEPLDVDRMLHTPEGKSRISIFSIAHLGDEERMFFVSLLLNQMLGWMRSQSGTTSLRALLYMDEIYGYLPPTANPPSKKPMMTMLKQARAFGLGVLLATQNPVDLDYKALSNIGSWFLGRLQTERDKARVLDGLEGAAASSDSGFDRSAMEQKLAALGSRVFLMNNVHEDEPVTFHVRWVMSYLRGPLARNQIRQLMADRRDAVAESGSEPAEDAPAKQVAPTEKKANAPGPEAERGSSDRPRLPRGAEEFFLPVEVGESYAGLSYVPMMVASATVRYDDSRKGIDGEKVLDRCFEIDPRDADGSKGEGETLPGGLKLTQASLEPVDGIGFEELPEAMLGTPPYTALRDDWTDELYRSESITVFKSPLSGLYSTMGESEGAFRGRLEHEAREVRDKKIADLRSKYAKKVETLERSVGKAMDKVEDQKSQASQAKVDTAMKIGGTILSAVLRRALSRRTSSAMSSSSRAWKESRDVARAEEELARVQADLAEMEAEAREAEAELKEAMDPSRLELEAVKLSPLKKNIEVKKVGILWCPR